MPIDNLLLLAEASYRLLDRIEQDVDKYHGMVHAYAAGLRKFLPPRNVVDAWRQGQTVAYKVPCRVCGSKEELCLCAAKAYIRELEDRLAAVGESNEKEY